MKHIYNNKRKDHSRISKMLHEMSSSNCSCVYSRTFSRLFTAAATSLSFRSSSSPSIYLDNAAVFLRRFVSAYDLDVIAFNLSVDEFLRRGVGFFLPLLQLHFNKGVFGNIQTEFVL